MWPKTRPAPLRPLPISAICGGSCADPALERAGEGALLGKAGQKRDLGQRQGVIAQKAFGKIAAGVFGEGLKTHPVLGQTAMEGPRAVAKAAGNVGHLRCAFAQRLCDGVLGLDQKRGFGGDLGQFTVKMRHQIARDAFIPEDVRLRQGLGRDQQRIEIRLKSDRAAEIAEGANLAPNSLPCQRQPLRD